MKVDVYIQYETCLCRLVLSFTSLQITALESMAEAKAAGTADNGPTATTESTAKPPPFKDPVFMVSICCVSRCSCSDCLWISLSHFFFLLCFLTLGSILGLAEQQQVKRTAPGRISNRFWLWSGLYHGSSMIPIVRVCILRSLPHLCLLFKLFIFFVCFFASSLNHMSKKCKICHFKAKV